MKLTAQDYRSTLEVTYEFDTAYGNYKDHYFETHCRAKIAELEKPEPQLPMYRCIKLPAINSVGFKLGELYVYSMRGCDFSYSELPLHFELVVPEPEKITWQQISDLIENFKHNNYLPHKVYIADLVRILERIKTDHL